MKDLKIFTENIEPEALSQIYTLVKQPAFSNCKVRIMPDVHAGAGCVIGFTADLGEKVIPNIVGVDIGCGMLTVELGKIEVDFEKLDKTIRKYVPSGRNVREVEYCGFPQLQELCCYDELKDTLRIRKSLGSLGGGNHFIEVDKDAEGNCYLVIHTGSRNLGKQVAEYYQNLAISTMMGKDKLNTMQAELIADYKKHGRVREIEQAVTELRRNFNPNPHGVPKELCYLTGNNREDYLNDMEICQQFAILNRNAIARTIIDHMGFHPIGAFETIHNYIEFGTNMVRKGAISAKAGERVLIPINMRDGCIIGIGKGNPEWNYSAPHGAGRVMSRSKAKEAVTLKEFEESMRGIFTTSVCQSTVDESPMVYKSIDEIVKNISETVKIDKIIKPIYNFKASD